MRVELHKSHRDSYIAIARQVNSAVESFTDSKYKPTKIAKNTVFAKNTTVEKKKRILLKTLEEVIIKTFSIDLDKINSKKSILSTLKTNLKVLRMIVNKLRDINYYLEENFLAEIGLRKRSLKVFKSKNPEKLIESSRFLLSKKYINKLEHTTYKLIEKIIIFDKKLLENYKEKQEKIIKDEKIEIKDLTKLFKEQTELLNHLEAKLPPAKEIKAKLLQKTIFNQWVPRVFALLASIKEGYKKEQSIFKQLNKKEKIRKIINKKIRSLEKEKTELIRLKEKRLSNNIKMHDNEFRLMLHDLRTVKKL